MPRRGGKRIKSEWSGTLPHGAVTTSQRRYVREWRAFIAPIEYALEARCIAFDPGLSLSRLDGRGSGIYFDRYTAVKLHEALTWPAPKRARRGR